MLIDKFINILISFYITIITLKTYNSYISKRPEPMVSERKI